MDSQVGSLMYKLKIAIDILREWGLSDEVFVRVLEFTDVGDDIVRLPLSVECIVDISEVFFRGVGMEVLRRVSSKELFYGRGCPQSKGPTDSLGWRKIGYELKLLIRGNEFQSLLVTMKAIEAPFA